MATTPASPQDPEPTKSEKVDLLVRTFDELAQARARQQVSIFVENAARASYHAETAAQAKELLSQQLELIL